MQLKPNQKTYSMLNDCLLKKRISAIIASSNVVSVIHDADKNLWLMKIPDFKHFKEYRSFSELSDEYTDEIKNTSSRFDFLARRELLAAQLHQRVCGKNSTPELRTKPMRLTQSITCSAIASKFIPDFTEWSQLDNKTKRNAFYQLIEIGVASIMNADVDLSPHNIGTDKNGILIKVDFGSCLDEGIIDPIDIISSNDFKNIFNIEGLFRGFGDLNDIFSGLDYEAAIKEILNRVLEIKEKDIVNDIRIHMSNGFGKATKILEEKYLKNLSRLKDAAQLFLLENTLSKHLCQAEARLFSNSSESNKAYIFTDLEVDDYTINYSAEERGNKKLKIECDV